MKFANLKLKYDWGFMNQMLFVPGDNLLLVIDKLLYKIISPETSLYFF